MNYIFRNCRVLFLYCATTLLTFTTIITYQMSGLVSAETVENNEAFSSKKMLRQISIKGKLLNFSDVPLTYVSADNPSTLEEYIEIENYKKVSVIATGYTAGFESTGKTSEHPAYGITFSGVEVTRDLYSTIAADLDIYPIGTIFYIPSYGYGVVADKGSAIKGRKLDLYYESVSDVYEEWGKHELDVYLIEEGNGELTEEMLLALNEDEAMQAFRSQFIGKEE